MAQCLNGPPNKGLGRTRRGRTPIGRYRVAPARASSRYHLFLEVGYPTAEQAKLGLTGSAIGVHGPHPEAFRT